MLRLFDFMQMTFKGCLFERIQGFFLVDGLAVRELPNGPMEGIPGNPRTRSVLRGKSQMGKVSIPICRAEAQKN